MFKRILVGTDLLGACDAAVTTALEIAKQNQGRLFIMHVLEPSYLHECGPLEYIKDFKTGVPTAATEEYKETVREELDKRCGGALKSYGNYEIDIAYGRPFIEIRRWARKFGSDLIVLGPHAGWPEEEKALIGGPLGNTVEDVIQHATSPVMIVNRLLPKEKMDFKKIMVCVDFSKSCDYAFQFATKMAQRYVSKLFLFHSAASPSSGGTVEGDLAATRERLKATYKMPQAQEHEYSVWQGTPQPHLDILKYASEKDMDLVVMGSRSREMVEKTYVGSAVEQVSADCTCPVAVVTHPDALLKM
jgi:nucleotide-binding universal stress UspA family protein